MKSLIKFEPQAHTLLFKSCIVSAILLFSIFSFITVTVAKETKFLPNAEFVPGEIIVKIKSGASISDIIKTHNFQYSERILAQFKATETTEKSAKIFGLDRLYVGKLKTGENFEDTLKALKDDPLVEYAEPNYLVHAESVPNDPGFSEQWGMQKIQAPAAWDLSTASAVTVGVIDSGIDYTHEDLAANMWENPGEIPENSIDDDGNGFIDDVYGWNFVAWSNNPMDDYGHGTHVAGIIAAAGNNSIGVTGVTWTMKVSAIKFLDSNGVGTMANAIRAIRYATTMGFQVTNNSWVGDGFFYPPLYDVIAAANASGNLFVAAAGNSGLNTDTQPIYPAAYDLPNIISVTATDKNDRLAKFSNYGLISVDLGAPGVNIYSTLPRGSCKLCNSSGYGQLSGTSMASPHVAGAAALLWSYTPALSNFDIKNRLLGSTDVVNGLKRKTESGGRLNVYNALTNFVRSF